MQRPVLDILIMLKLFIGEIRAKESEPVDYIYYSPWWVASRVKFKFPMHFASLRIYYFDEWDTFKPLWWKAWHLVEGANYEVPLYLREKNYIPTNWRLVSPELCKGFAHRGLF